MVRWNNWLIREVQIENAYLSHELTEWWPNWTHRRFLPMPSVNHRQILEFLLILGLKPAVNQKPGAVFIEKIVKKMEGD